MSGLAGWIGRADAERDTETLARMAQALQDPGDRGDVMPGRAAGLAAASLHGRAHKVARRGSLLVALAGSPRFLDATLAGRAAASGVAEVFADCWRERGSAAFALLGGGFAAAILDEASGEAALAIDRMGVFGLAFHALSGALLFGTSADALNRHPLARPELDRQALYDYIFHHMVAAPRTIYRDQERLLPGEYVLWRNGRAERGAYWVMRFQEDGRGGVEELRDEFRTTLRDAVRDAAAGETTGAFLSGGTDSSTLAGMLGDVTGRPARTYSIGFAAEGYDEMEYARIASRHFQTDHHEYYVTPDDVVAAVPRIAAAYDQPFGNSSAVPTLYCAALARKDGITRMLGGDGGDELFGGNERYARQHVFALYERVPAALRRALIEPLAFGLPGGARVPPIRKARSYIEQASVPMPARLETYNLLERFGQGAVFEAEFLAEIDRQAPLAALDAVWQQAQAGTLINRMLALDLKFTLADNDLPKVTRTCALAGVDVAFPMLHESVVDFSARLAPQMKLKGRRLRYFFKEALRGYLPDAIITKQKHGFGLPFGPWLQTHRPLQDLTRDSLQALKRRHLVRSDFLDTLTDHVAEHPGYYGTMVWVLMLLEQWFRTHHDPR